MERDNIKDLKCYYEQIYAALTHRFSQAKDKLSVLAIGGGGYVFPRYIEEVWPESRIDVVEIDPVVTEAAIQAFGLKRNSTINTITMDARNYVDELLERKHNQIKTPQYDFIYGDAFNDYSVPFHLITKEFNDKIAQIMSDDSIYMVNVIDIFDIGKFLGAAINTFQQTFPNVYVLSKRSTKNNCTNFVIIAAKQAISLENIEKEEPIKNLDIWLLNNVDIRTLKEKARGVILTDDYAPVENLFAPVVRKIAYTRG